jgi:hypothetical protein
MLNSEYIIPEEITVCHREIETGIFGRSSFYSLLGQSGSDSIFIELNWSKFETGERGSSRLRLCLL